MSTERQPDGTSSHTVESAASAIVGLLSDSSEHPETAEAHEPEQAEVAEEGSGDEEQPEQLESQETESDDATDGDEPAEEQTEDEQTSEAPKTRKIKVDGEEIEVTEEELEKGYSRTADYTRKTQALAKEKAEVAEEKEAVRAERQQYAERLAQVQEALDAVKPAEPDWDTLRNEDPAEFAVRWAEHQQWTEREAILTAERQRVAEQVQRDQMEQLKSVLKQEQEKLLEALPEWKNEETAKREKTELVTYAGELGFTPEALAQVTDHRVMIMLRKAMLYDRAQKAKPEVLKKIDKVKTLTPGPSSRTTQQVSAATKARQRLAKTGRVEDAAEALRHML